MEGADAVANAVRSMGRPTESLTAATLPASTDPAEARALRRFKELEIVLVEDR